MRYRHLRRSTWDECSHLGGATLCIDVGGRSIGIAVCSDSDSYNKRQGRYIARDRAERNSYDGKNDVWNINAPKLCLTGFMRFAVHQAIKIAADSTGNHENIRINYVN